MPTKAMNLSQVTMHYMYELDSKGKLQPTLPGPESEADTTDYANLVPCCMRFDVRCRRDTQ